MSSATPSSPPVAPTDGSPDIQSPSSAGEHPHDASQHRVRFSISKEAGHPPQRDVAHPSILKPRTARAAGDDTIEGETSASTSASGRPYPPSAPSSSGQSRLSVISERTRARGYSLRRSFFNRPMNEQLDDATAPIELGHVGPSNAIPAAEERYTNASKKSMEASVNVEPVFDNDFSKPDTNPIVGGIQGISALPNYEKWIRQKTERNRLLRQVRQNFRKVRKFVLRIAEIPPSKDGRHILVDARRKERLIDERVGKPFIGNTIRSSRYNLWNFLPRQLFAQFSKIANFYFLCVSTMQMIPGLSTTGTYTTIIPLLFFVSISMAKEGFDDFRRYRLDKEENNKEASILHVYEPTNNASPTEQLAATPNLGLIHWANKKWKDIKVGDIIKLERDQGVPADIILLHSKGENGVAYIETMALDGETNLKSKQAVPCLARTCDTLENIALCNAHLVVEDPNLDLYNFEGKVTVDGETSPLSSADVIYRGSMLRNTPEAIGVVIYSGEECKIRMNANSNPRIKAPSLQAVVNRIIILIVIFVFALAIANTCAYVTWNNNAQQHMWYLKHASVGFGRILVSFIIMFNTMIPLSLYVSMEIIKVLQMLLLNDIDMYDADSDTPMEARTSTINEELGQITHVFSDKTGTLTDNSMKFRKLSVAGTAWLHDADLKLDAIKAERSRQTLLKKKSKGKKPARLAHGKASSEWPRHSGLASPPLVDSSHVPSGGSATDSGWKSSARPTKAQPEMKCAEMLHYIQRRPATAFARKAKLFLLSLALCHTCLPEKREDGTIGFQAASPDELALVQAAQEMGFMVIDRQSGVLTLKTYPNGTENEPLLELYEILDVIEFSSKRKRMSAIVRFPDKRICVICKGADTILMQLLRLSTLAVQKTVEIEKRAARRKSMEAHQAIVRKSEQIDAPTRHGSINIGRTSIALTRPSIGGAGRGSVSGLRSHPLRDQVDSWLTERETEIDASSFTDDTGAYYSPRPSGQFGRPSAQFGRPSGQFGRPSTAAMSEARTSEDTTDDYDLVDEALVIDEPTVIERCFQHINDFATEGLRTLLYAHRFMDEEEYATWKKVYKDATTSLVNRQSMIEKAGEMIERNFELDGATAIEDKLQKGVPETIDKLRRANIKMWMLTGDKRETAINIGHSCRLIKDYSSVTVLDHESGQVEQAIAAAIVEVNRGSVAHSVVVVDGQTLAMIDTDHGLQKLFYDLAIVTDSVICCRASPSQKAGLVKAIRRKVKSSITLAIGDGANDIAMIQEAHVGIGITGKEGLQAARTSDYSIAQFRFLSKLLLVHGRWNYIRTCKYILATFWKEMTFYLIQAWYQRYTGYTATSLYESWSLSMFNTLFTSLPVIFMGVFEKDLNPATLLAVPELYVKGQRNGGFNLRIYLGWMVMAAIEACVIFYGMIKLDGLSARHNNDLFSLGNICFTSVVALTNFKLQFIEMHTISAPNLVAAGVSTGGWMLWNVFLAVSYSAKTPLYHAKGGFFRGFGRDPGWWATMIFIVSALLLLEILVKVLKAGFAPTDTDVFQALEQDPATRRRFEDACALELQQGWDAAGYVAHRTGDPEVDNDEVRVQAEREGEVAEMLRRRGVFDDVAPDELAHTSQQQQQQQQQQRKRSLVSRKSLGELFKGGGVTVGVKEL